MKLAVPLYNCKRQCRFFGTGDERLVTEIRLNNYVVYMIDR